jgi:hypothetical protein
MTVAELWRRGQAGWPRRFPVVQFPNPPLLMALAARAASGVGERDGPAAGAGRSLFVLGVAMWALEELAEGANWFRRLLGVAGLAWVLRFALGAAAPASPTLDDAAVPGTAAATESDSQRATSP